MTTLVAGDLTKVLAKFDAFDADNSGVLSPGQVGDMLKFMNGGAEVSRDEIDWVIECADDSKEGSLNKDEIGAAVAVWYGRVVDVPEVSTSCACVIS
jgi:Ca2+-binding EF-hand superfamily protein